MSYGDRDKTDPQADKAGASKRDSKIIAECAKRMAESYDLERHNRLAAEQDLRMLIGDHWPEHIRALRGDRPCLTINTLPTFLSQVTNDMRQNKISIKVAPVDGKADPETSKVYQGLIKHIEYASNADACQHYAATGAAACGEGYYRLINDFESHNSFHQTIRFEPILDPACVAFDPFGKQPDGSDRMWYAFFDDVSRDTFEASYPDADACDFEVSSTLTDTLSNWVGIDTVRVVEYYRIEEVSEILCLLADGSTKWEGDLREGDQLAAGPDNKRKSKRKKVQWFKLSAKEILDETEIPCEWIPVFPIYGAEVRIGGRTHRSSLIRNATDSARMYNVWISTATEEYGNRSKAPWIIAEGQSEGYEDIWDNANRGNPSSLTYKPTTVDGVLVPPPQRQPMVDVPVGALTMAGHMRDDQKAAMGLFDSSMGNRGTATSGIQERAQQQQGQITNLHFDDNRRRAATFAGRCLLSMMPRVYDTARVVRIMGDDDTISFAEINTPKVDPKTGVRRIMNNLLVGKYDLVTTAGPSYATQRLESAESLREMVKAYPPMMQFAGDKIVKSMNVVDGDIIAERFKKTIPQELIKGEDKDSEDMPIPPQVEQQMQQMQGQIQQYEAALSDAIEQLKAKQTEQQATIEAAKIKAQADTEVAMIKARADIEAKTKIAKMESRDRRAVRVKSPDGGEYNGAITMEGGAQVYRMQSPSGAVFQGGPVDQQQEEQEEPEERKTIRVQGPSGAVYEGEIVTQGDTKHFVIQAPSGAVYEGEVAPEENGEGL